MGHRYCFPGLLHVRTQHIARYAGDRAVRDTTSAFVCAAAAVTAGVALMSPAAATQVPNQPPAASAQGG